MSSNVWQGLSHDSGGQMMMTDFARGVRPLGGTPPPASAWPPARLGRQHADVRGAMWGGHAAGRDLWRVPVQVSQARAP